MTRTLRTQRYVGALFAALLLSACQSKPALDAPESTQASTPAESAGKAVQRLAPSTLPLLTTPGAWVKPPQGPLFEPMDTLDPRNAMVYVYRPSTSWEDQELQAPSFFLDGTKVFGLKSGSYTWVEVHAGTYKFYAKRPLLILFIKKIFELDMKVDGGRNYYFRYSEDAPFDYKADHLKEGDFMHAGYLQEVPESVALAEIGPLKLDQQGVYFEAGKTVRQHWAPFEAFARTGAPAEETAAAPAGSAAANANADAAPEHPGWWSRTKSFFSDLRQRL